MPNDGLDNCLGLSICVPYFDGPVAGASYGIGLPKYLFIEKTSNFSLMWIRNMTEEPKLMLLVVSESLC